MTPEQIDRATVLQLAHAYADEKLARYGLIRKGPYNSDPEAAFAALVTAVDGLIALVAAHEREKCAKACEALQDEAEKYSGPEAAGWLDTAAKAFRSRAEQSSKKSSTTHASATELGA
jgi:hypothetical protein